MQTIFLYVGCVYFSFNLCWRCLYFVKTSRIIQCYYFLFFLISTWSNDTQLVEALITEIYEGGGYCLEYTPDGAEQNEVLCYDADMLEVSEEKYDPEQKILLYKSDCKNQDILIIFCILFYTMYTDIDE